MTSLKIYDISKRLLDITVSILCIIFLSPVFVVISVLIWLDSADSPIFIQKRIGKNGVLFMLYKFRTMKKETPAYMLKPGEDDVRITRIGRFLRNTGLDELPQLFNILKGEMTLVGPRPEMPFIVAGYQEREKERLKVKPGITGLWQLSGKTNLPIHYNLEYDLFYIKKRSLLLDLKILSETLTWFLRNMPIVAIKFFIKICGLIP